MITLVAALIVSIGAPISNPESVTGVWESRSSPAQPSIAGLAIQINTAIDGQATTLRHTEQRIEGVNIVTYVRDREHSKRTWWNTSMQGTFDWHDNHLRLHEEEALGDPFDVNLDLVFDPRKSAWSGSFANPDFSGTVLLKRPDYQEPKSPVGIWRSGEVAQGQFECVHLGMATDGQLVIWADFIRLPGFVHYSAQYPPPVTADESYGVLMNDPNVRFRPGVWIFDLATDLGGEFIAGKLSDDGATFTGESTHYGNGIYPVNGPYARPFRWQRVNGSSCAI